MVYKKCVVCLRPLLYADFICVVCQKDYRTNEEIIIKKLKRLGFID